MLASQQKSIPEWITAHKARDTACRRERDPDSWKSRTTTKSHHTNLTQNICWEKHERLVASAQVRNNRELSRRQTLHSILWGRSFQGDMVLVWLLWPDIGASSWTGEILFFDFGLPTWVKSFLSLCCDLRVKSGSGCSFVGSDLRLKSGAGCSFLWP